MKTVQVSEFKSNFSEIMDEVKNGESFQIVFGQLKKPIAIVNPIKSKVKKRKLGILEGKVKVSFARNGKLTEEELISG
jgi:antitoxin (DNA-binding transcriptional repressor) of toxin-antitoxin stability system